MIGIVLIAGLAASAVGVGAIQKLLTRYGCPTSFHVVHMRFWGEIVSPAQKVSLVQTIESLWPAGLPAFESADDANAFFQALMGLWNHLAGYQSGPRSLKLTKVGAINSREGLHAAAKIRVEELYEGFMRRFTGGQVGLDVPAGVGAFRGSRRGSNYSPRLAIHSLGLRGRRMLAYWRS